MRMIMIQQSLSLAIVVMVSSKQQNNVMTVIMHHEMDVIPLVQEKHHDQDQYVIL